MLSSIATESFYVIDLAAGRICYVRSDNPFLCGYSAEDALKSGYDFYKKIIHPDDLLLWEKIRTVIFSYLNDCGKKRDEIDYFSCTFRLQRKYSFAPRPLQQMLYHRMKPVWVDNKLCYLICSAKSSAVRKAGNLCMYHRYELTYEAYNFISRRWKQKAIEPLTERERAILMLAQQGKNAKEIACDLCKGFHTIRNQIKPIFSKLNTHSMQEAVEFVICHRILFPK
jgi:DNA-binding CsgD family transcriptional regulator